MDWATDLQKNRIHRQTTTPLQIPESEFTKEKVTPQAPGIPVQLQAQPLQQLQQKASLGAVWCRWSSYDDGCWRDTSPEKKQSKKKSKVLKAILHIPIY